MYAIDLTGRHITHKVKITYRMKSWKVDRDDETISGYVGLIKHYPGGEVWITFTQTQSDVPHALYRTAVRIPFDAEVEIIE